MNLLTRFRAKSELQLGIDFRPIPFFLITHFTHQNSQKKFDRPFLQHFDYKMDRKIIL